MKKNKEELNKELEHKELFTPTSLRKGSKNRKASTTNIILVSLLVVVTIVAATLVVKYFQKPNGPEIDIPSDAFTYKVEENSYIYYNNNSTEFKKNTSFYIKENLVYGLLDEYNEQEVNLPIYLESGNEVITVTTMLFYTPRVKGFPNKIDTLTRIIRNNKGSLVVSRKDKSVAINRGFLYDCKDFYLFLEPMKVSINNKYTEEVSAFSYIEVVPNGDVSIFDFGTKKWSSYPCEGVCTATPINEDITTPVDYTVNLVGDQYVDASGARTLLSSDAEIFDALV